jgi:hypothetical protein
MELYHCLPCINRIRALLPSHRLGSSALKLESAFYRSGSAPYSHPRCISQGCNASYAACYEIRVDSCPADCIQESMIELPLITGYNRISISYAAYNGLEQKSAVIANCKLYRFSSNILFWSLIIH